VDSSAIMPEDGCITSFNGKWHNKKTTNSWDICIEWHDGTSLWVPLKDVKQSNPLELADYAVAIVWKVINLTAVDITWYKILHKNM